MIHEFRAFLTKTNALALAIGVIIGAALGAVVNSLVNDIIMPPIGWLLGGVDFAALKIVLGRCRQRGSPRPRSRSATAPSSTAVITFVIVALVVFLIARTFIKEEAAVPTKDCPFCRRRTPQTATKCKACASAI